MTNSPTRLATTLLLLMSSAFVTSSEKLSKAVNIEVNTLLNILRPSPLFLQGTAPSLPIANPFIFVTSTSPVVVFGTSIEILSSLAQQDFQAQLELSFSRYIRSSEDFLHAYLRFKGVNISNIEGHTGFQFEKAKLLTKLHLDVQNEVVCEIGYNAGHSSLNALLSKEESKVYSFDIGDHLESYLRHSYELLDHTFPERLTLILGDSATTIPVFAKTRPDVKCNLIFVDGGHTKEQVMKDLEAFRGMVNQTHHVLVVDDTDFPDVQAGWHDYIEMGLAVEHKKVSSRKCSGYKLDWFEPYKTDQLVPTECDLMGGGSISVGSYVFLEGFSSDLNNDKDVRVEL